MAEQLKIVIDADISKAEKELQSFTADIKQTELALNKFAQSVAKPLVFSFDKSAVQKGVSDLKSELAGIKGVSVPVVPKVEQVNLPNIKPIPLSVIPEVKTVNIPNIKPVPLEVIPKVDAVNIPNIKPIPLEVIPKVDPVNLPNVKPIVLPVIPKVEQANIPQIKPVPLPIIPQVQEIKVPTIKPLIIPVNIDDSQVFKLSQTIQVLESKIGSIKGSISVETDIRKIVLYNKELQSLEDEVKLLKTLGKTGFENFFVPSKAIQSLKTLEDRVKSFGGGVTRFIPPVISSFEKIPSSVLKASSALQRLPQSSNQATQAMINLGRVVQDAPFGFIGIANNLNPLLESFQRLKTSTGSTGGALKALGSSLLGAGGLGFAVSVASSLLLVFGDRIFGAGKKAKEAAVEIKSISDIIGDATDSVQGDIAKVNALKNAFANTTSFSEQKRVVEELKKTNESYFGQLKAGVSTYNDITIAANAYTQSLVQQAVVKGLQDEISKVSGELRKAQNEYNKLAPAALDAGEALNKSQQAFTNAKNRSGDQSKVLKTLQADVNRLSIIYNGLNSRLGESGKSVVEFNKDLTDLTSEINRQVGIQLNFKPLDKPKKDFKDATDDILSRARAFVKEFGDVFVLPDLEVSFTNTDKIVKEKSIELLKNVDSFLKGNIKALQIRIPVETNFDLIPEPTEVITKEIQDNFLKSIGIQVDIPVEPKIILTDIDKKIADSKLDLRKKFSIFGDLGFKEFAKIDFSNVNAGIEKGTKLFNDMLAVAQTLQQSIGQGLTGAFNAVFDAVLEGKNVFKALANAVKELVVGTIKAIAQMLILKLVTNLIFPGGGAAGGAIAKAVGGQANLFGLGNQIGSRAFTNTLQVVVTGQLSGQNILLSGQRAANSGSR